VNDTPPDVARRVRDLSQRRSPGERVLMACSMFDMAKALAEAGIRATSPGISEIDVRIRLFDRFYGRDFGPADRTAILDRIRQGR
jgi:hypothetical protein